MTFEAFNATLPDTQPPAGLSDCLTALWYAGKEYWAQAHHIAQEIETKDGSWIHAYLHRVEGDTWNAGYWYTRAGRPMPVYSFEKEWEELVRAML